MLVDSPFVSICFSLCLGESAEAMILVWLSLSELRLDSVYGVSLLLVVLIILGLH